MDSDRFPDYPFTCIVCVFVLSCPVLSSQQPTPELGHAHGQNVLTGCKAELDGVAKGVSDVHTCGAQYSYQCITSSNTTLMFCGCLFALQVDELTLSAKVAHLSEGRLHTTFPEGSPEADYCHGRARWKDAPGVSSQQPAISQAFRGMFQVILADTTDSASASAVKRSDYNMQGLTTRHDYLRVTRASLVLERGTFYVLGVFVTSRVASQLIDLAEQLPLLYTTMDRHLPDCCDRPGLRMFGCRYNKYGKGLAHMGYYCCRDAWDLYEDGEVQNLVVNTVSGVCDLESLISPPMGEERRRHAQESCHLGIWPRTSIVKCPASALGISRGYGSRFHNDYGDQMSETILFDTRDVPTGSGYCFAIARARVVFSLLESEVGDAAMTMVQGTVLHGTPDLNPGFGAHGGIGCVMVNKTNLLSAQNVRWSKLLDQRLDSPEWDSICPFTSEFAACKKRRT